MSGEGLGDPYRQVLLALPVFNEEAALPKLFQALQNRIASGGYPNQIIVVNDGSTDRTPKILELWSSRLPLHVVLHRKNQGLGESIQDALKCAAAMAAPDDVIVTMDADNTHSTSLIDEMVRAIGEGYDVVIASRYRPGSSVVGLSFPRLAMSYGARLLFQLLFPISGVRDYTSGFRAYRGAVLHRLLERYRDRLAGERGFASMAEILLKLRSLNARMCEVPMVLRYDLKGGPSKMNVPLTVLKTFSLAVRNRVRTGRPERPRPPR